MDHNFTGPLYTLGVEEELMIVDGEDANVPGLSQDGHEVAPSQDRVPRDSACGCR